MNNERKKSRRGFAAMSPEKQRAIARMGGKAAQATGTAHQWTPEEAAAAGRIGGKISRRRPSTRQEKDLSKEETQRAEERRIYRRKYRQEWYQANRERIRKQQNARSKGRTA